MNNLFALDHDEGGTSLGMVLRGSERLDFWSCSQVEIFASPPLSDVWKPLFIVSWGSNNDSSNAGFSGGGAPPTIVNYVSLFPEYNKSMLQMFIY